MKAFFYFAFAFWFFAKACLAYSFCWWQCWWDIPLAPFIRGILRKVWKMPSQVSPVYNLLIDNVSMWNFSLHRGFTKFHICGMSVNLGEAWWKPKVSHGGAMNQLLTGVWNLWRQFANLYFFDFKVCLRACWHEPPSLFLPLYSATLNSLMVPVSEENTIPTLKSLRLSAS